MSFAGEGIQNKLWKFVIKYKKYLGIGCVIAFIGSMFLVVSSFEKTKQYSIATDIIIECQNLEKQKKYAEAYASLQTIYTKYQSLLEKNSKFQSAVNVYNYKLGLLRKNAEDAVVKIKKTTYVSQWYDYNDFSIAGEIELMHKTIISYHEKNFEECNRLFFERQMLKLPNFVANFYRAMALFDNNQKAVAREFLAQSMYKHDYTQGYAKDIIRNLFFLLD